jgi:ketosteroid isomerase-like protein
MSKRNVELTAGTVAAFNRRDIEALIAYCAPEVEFHSTFAAVGGALYHGHDGVRSWHRDLEEAWGGDIRVEVEAYFDLGESTLVFYAMQARGRQSGAEVWMPAAQLLRWRDGLMIEFRGYPSRAAAVADLGVSPDDLRPVEV